ncbi:hypothetical protein [Methanorbis furvi]|uniref:Uncharacterized protein n=1 Tax=Methanorbis furvi TaxID=3028299 RepID=A0AAE4S9A8_9EURY|nr:hypothetical protein [Methanocorpusculaceae archaeon Ag1]
MPVINNPYVNPVDLNNTAPKVHGSQHKKGGSDPLTPADIGAAAENHTHNVSGLAVAWQDVTSKPNTFPATLHAATHGQGGGDLLALDASQITSGTVPLARLPHGCLERLVIVQDDTARFALTTAEIQEGDTVKVVATSTMYFVVDETKLNSPDGYVAYTAGAASAVDWSAITGKPTTFKPETHSHDDVTVLKFCGVPLVVKTDLTALSVAAYSSPQTSGMVSASGTFFTLFTVDAFSTSNVVVRVPYRITSAGTVSLSGGGISVSNNHSSASEGTLTLTIPVGVKIGSIVLKMTRDSSVNSSSGYYYYSHPALTIPRFRLSFAELF